MLLLFLVELDLVDRFDFSATLRLPHLLEAERDDLLLLSVLGLDQVLEVRDALIDVGLRVLPHFGELLEFCNLVVLLERLATVNEHVLGVVDVSFFECLYGLLLL